MKRLLMAISLGFSSLYTLPTPVYMTPLIAYLLTGCGTASTQGSSESNTTDTSDTSDSTAQGATHTFKLEAWADNWFAAYLENDLIVEDSVSITTERSFNSETMTFSGSYPLQLNFIIKDYKQNDTGLEYIGQPNQQMGDGGFFMQVTDESLGTVAAVSNANMKCMVIHKAPLDKQCENEANPVAGAAPCTYSALDEPAGWKSATFDDTGWSAASVYTKAQIGVKEGYYDIGWDSDAELIWGSDLESDNTLLCRLSVEAPEDATTDETPSNSSDFTLGGDAFKSADQLPFAYTCDGLQSSGERGGRAPTLNFENAPNGTEAYAVTMHIMKGTGDRLEREVLWILYDIPADVTTLNESDADMASAGLLGISEQGENVYFPPCSKDPIENRYTLTAYALSQTLGIDPGNATFDTVTAQAKSKALATATLELSNLRYNPDDVDQPFVPTKVPVTCAEKSEAFTLYEGAEVTCDEASNTMTVTSKTGIPERSELYVDRLNVGTQAWIGRVPIPSETQWSFPMNPTYHSAPLSNVNIHQQIGITVDGIPMLHYAKENYPDEIADLLTDYSDRDTVLLGELDQCGGHAGNGEDYHYHYAPICMMDTHDPSQPLAYMMDGLPLYFGTGGGTVTDQGGITPVNYGGGRYDELNFLPSDVKDGTNPLDECNAYDLGGDGAASGYVYYTTKEPPYTIGCFRAESSQQQSGYPRWDIERDISWSGADVELSDYYTTEFEGSTWYLMEVTPDVGNNKIAAGKVGAILWRALQSGESGYEADRSCWLFRYRLDKTDTAGANDTVATHCRG